MVLNFGDIERDSVDAVVERTELCRVQLNMVSHDGGFIWRVLDIPGVASTGF